MDLKRIYTDELVPVVLEENPVWFMAWALCPTQNFVHTLPELIVVSVVLQTPMNRGSRRWFLNLLWFLKVTSGSVSFLSSTKPKPGGGGPSVFIVNVFAVALCTLLPVERLILVQELLTTHVSVTSTLEATGRTSYKKKNLLLLMLCVSGFGRGLEVQ